MNIVKTQDGSNMTLALEGRLDTMTSPQLEAAVNEVIDSVENLKFDFASLEYISSAGLRILLAAQKKMMAKGTMVVCNVNETIMDIFDVTGFSSILTIE